MYDQVLADSIKGDLKTFNRDELPVNTIHIVTSRLIFTIAPAYTQFSYFHNHEYFIFNDRKTSFLAKKISEQEYTSLTRYIYDLEKLWRKYDTTRNYSDSD